MKRAAIAVAVVFAAFWCSCGGGSKSANPPSGSKHRLLVTNQASGLIFLVDYQKDIFLGSGIASLTSPQTEYVSADRKIALVYDDSAHTLSEIDTVKETVTQTFGISGRTESVLIKPDNSVAYVAIPTYPQQDSSGAVLILDLVNGGVKSVISAPAAQRLALSPNGSNLLVFTNDVDTFSYIDLTVAPPVSLGVPAVAGMSRPYAAFFPSDTTAFVLNCGNGCGGTTTPSVQAIDIASLKAGVTANPPVAPTAEAPVPVGGGTVGLLDGNNLYVAGNNVNTPGQTVAQMSALTLSGSTASVTFTVNIGDGFHNLMVKSQNGKVWVGALTCQNTVNGCLSVVDTGSQQVALGAPLGPVTGFAEVTSRKLMFVCEGGEINHYDIASLNVTTPVDVVGYAYDVKVLDLP